MKTENMFLLLAPKFNLFGADIFKQYARASPSAKLYGIHTGDKKQREAVEGALSGSLGKIWLLSEEERKWQKSKVSSSELKRIDEMYGEGALGQIITSDRRVGRGFVTGGICRPDYIADLSIKESARIPALYAAALIAAVEDMVDEASPRVVFCYAVAGSLAVVLAMVCRLKGIPFTCFSAARIRNRYVVDTDVRGRLEPVNEKYAQVRENPSVVETHILDAREIQQAFMEKPVLPEYMIRNHQLIKNRDPWLGTLRVVKAGLLNILKLRFDSATLLNVRRMLHQNKIEWAQKLSSSKLFSLVPEGHEYIYFPLHVDPEASTMVMSPMHTDQLSVIEALAKSAPSEMILVVKEHLPMVGRRPKGFYERIRRMPRVILVSPHLDSFELVKKASMVAVITGTAVWEAIRLKVPALVIGDSPYICIKNSATYEPCLTNLAKSIKEELGSPAPDDDEIVFYIAALLSESFELPSEVLWGNYRDQPPEYRKKISTDVAGWIEKRVTG